MSTPPPLQTDRQEAWVAVDDRTPVILDVPEVKGRYYTAQILDEWGEVIANINERTMPSKPFGKFALVKPGSTARIPADAARIELHSSKAKLLGRVELKGDPDGAVKLQQAFKLTSLGKPVIAKPVALPMFENKDLIGAAIFDKVDAQLKKVVPEFQEYAFTKSAPYRNHWVGGAAAGNYGTDYWLRTTANFGGVWANSIDEVTYFVATRDADEKLLNGSNSYVIHFPADHLPQTVVDAYWSVILVGVLDYRVAPNPLNRFNFNTYSKLASEADGSLKIAVGPKPVAGVPESNWLPAPEGKTFSLTFRTYVPKEIVRKGDWQPAPVTKVN